MTYRPDPRQVSEWFYAAENLEGEERRQFLERCPDERLRQWVEQLLACASRATPEGKVATPLASVPVQATPAPTRSVYEDLNELGRGGMGVVYRDRDVALGRDVALKSIREDVVVGRSALRQRFAREALITARLNHPGIPPVYEVGTLPDGRPFMAMKLVEGQTLHELLREQGPGAGRWLATFEAICQAVAYAHSRGVIHRDLKPHNVMVGQFGEVQVMDWGLGKVLSDPRACPSPPSDAAQRSEVDDPTRQTDLAATRVGTVLGTLAYAPPEQARGATDQLDRRSDVFGLGAILCALLTGKPPFLGADDESRREPADLGDVFARLNCCGAEGELIALAKRCLSKEPNDRFADAGELAHEVAALRARWEERARKAELQKARAESREQEQRRGQMLRRVGAGIVVLVLLAGIAGTAAGLISARNEADGRAKTAEKLRDALTQTQRQVTLSTWDRGRQLCEDGEVGRGLLLLAKALESAPSGDEGEDLRDALRLELAAWLAHCPTVSQVWEHPAKVTAVAVSLDGKQAATGCADGKVRLWDLESGRLGHVLTGHHKAVNSVGFCQDGTLVSCGDGKVLLWNAEAGKQIGSLEGHTGEVYAVALSPDGTLALTGGADKTARLWDVRTRTVRAILDTDGAVRAVAFGSRGDLFVAAGNGAGDKGMARIWKAVADDPRRFEEQCLLYETNKPVLSAAISPGGELLLGDEDWNVSLWEVKSSKRFAQLDCSHGDVCAAAFAPDGHSALIGIRHSKQAQLVVTAALRRDWQRSTKKGIRVEVQQPRRFSSLPHPGAVEAVAFCPDGKRFLTACEDRCVRVWRVAPGPSVKLLKHKPKQAADPPPNRDFVVRAVAFHPDGTLVATAGWDGKVRFWKVPDGSPEGEPLVHQGRLMAVAFTPDGSVLTGGRDGLLRRWDLRTRRLTLTAPHHAGVVSGLSVSHDGELMFAGGAGKAQRWDVQTGRKIGEPLSHGKANESVATAISSDKRRLLTAAEDDRAILWDQDGTQLKEMRHQNDVYWGSFSHDGTTVVTASDDGFACLWDANSGVLRAALPHRGSVFSAAFTRKDRLLLTGSREGGQLWDVRSRKRVGPAYRSKEDVMQVALSPDGNFAVMADWAGYGLLWALPKPIPGQPEQVARRIQAEVGQKLEEGGGWQALDGRAWLALRRGLDETAPTP